MRLWSRNLLRHYAQQMKLQTDDGEEEIWGFLQPIRQRTETLPTAQTPLGWTDRRLWRYWGEQELPWDALVIWNRKKLRVSTSRPYCLGNLTLWWATLELEKEAAICRN